MAKKITVSLKNYRQSPRKVRLLADLVRGKNAERSVAVLGFVGKRASKPIGKLISSAIASARSEGGAKKENLFIEKIEVNEGPTLRRSMPRARGRAARINKRTSHVTLTLAEKEGKKKV